MVEKGPIGRGSNFSGRGFIGLETVVSCLQLCSSDARPTAILWKVI